jgi:hypothetical protein
MLKINSLRSRDFPNSLHVQCVTEIKKVTLDNDPAVLGISIQYDDFSLWCGREDEAFKFIRRSKLTEEKATADQERDLSCNGLCNYVKATTNHYNSEIAAAAHRLMVIVESFNRSERITQLAYDAETASIKSFLKSLREQQADFNLVNLHEWATSLENKNNKFEALAHEYVEDVVGKPEYNMLQARRGVEQSMRTMFHCIEALTALNGEASYTSYINSLNATIKHFNDVYAIRLGRYEVNKDKANASANEDEGENA